jgi:hypothetical protein
MNVDSEFRVQVFQQSVPGTCTVTTILVNVHVPVPGSRYRYK